MTSYHYWIRCLLIIILVLPLVSCLLPVKSFDEKKWHDQVEATDPSLLYASHALEGRFFNPWMPLEKEFSDFLLWKLSESMAYLQEEKKNKPEFNQDLYKRILSSPDDFVAWIGHATFLIRIKGEYWMTDPMFSERALLPKREYPPPFSLAEFAALPGKKNVILSHNHYDHLDVDSLKQIPEGTRFFVPLGLKKMMNDLGKKDVIEMDWWQAVTCGDDCRVICLPAQHWSRRIGQDTNTTLWASFLLEAGGRRIYFGGDSGYFIGFREIGRRYPGIDYALIPVTAYDPRWFMHYAHMDASEALKTFRDLGARYFIPTQWGTFQLSDEPIGHAPLALSKALKQTDIAPDRVLVMGIGQLLPLSAHSATNTSRMQAAKVTSSGITDLRTSSKYSPVPAESPL